MNFLENTDDEILRYEEAEIFRANAKPEFFPDEMKSKFNTRTGMTDLFAPLPSGGFAKLASQAPEIMVESPAMPGVVQPFSGQPVPLPVEGPLARAAESQPKTKQDTAQLGFFDNATSEIGKGLIRGAIVEPANFLKDNFGLYDPLVVQLVDPVTGEFDFDIKILSREEKADLDAKMAAGEMPYAISLDELVASDETAGTGSQAIGGMAQFVGAFAGLGKLFRVGQGFKAGMTQGAAADFLGFDGSDAGITDLLLSFGVPDAMLPDFLEKDPNDPDYIGRLKTAFEGAFIGGVIEKLIPLVGKVFRSIKDGDVPAEVVTQSISDGKEAMRQALLSAGENAQTRITERGTGTTMMSGVDPTVITDPLVAAAGRAAGDNLSKQVDNARIAYEAAPNDAALRKNYLGLRRQRDADPVAQVELPTDETPGIIAFHGSGTDFSEFKLEKIGTGEGAQAFGHGLYFADSEDIANFYRQTVGGGFSIDNFSIGGIDLVKRGTYRDYSPGATPFGRGPNTPVNQLSAKDYALSSALEDIFIDEYDLYDLKKATGAGDIQTPKSGDQLKQTIVARLQKTVDNKDPVHEKGEVEYLQGLISDIESGKAPIKFETEQHGHTYKVGLTPKPDDLLDYDKSFSEQTPTIQAALEKAGYKTERNMVVKEDGDNRFGVYETNDDGTEILLKHFTEPMLFKGPLKKQAQDFIVEQNAELLNNNGGQILAKLADNLGKTIRPVPLSADGTMMPTEQIASQALFEAGIPGIKYLDNTSRDGAGTSNNYVIFDDSMIKILEKYGIVGPVAISAMALGEDES